MSAPVVKTVKELFSGEATYRIPVYQRNYAWGEVQIKQLIDDVCDALDSTVGEYFLGNLVVSARSGTEFEVIDGQQRLTTLLLLLAQLRIGELSLRHLVYESRAKATLALERLVAGAGLPERADVDYSAEDAGIHAGSKVIAQYLAADGPAKRLRDPGASEFLMNKVVVVQVHIPERTDLNRYFEIMNTRGEQLRQQDIVKARLMSELPDGRDQACFAWIWDACADMDSYVQMRLTGQDTGFRSKLFDDDWSWLAPGSFDELNLRFSARKAAAGDRPRRAHPSSSVPLDEALIAYAQTGPHEKTDEGRARFTSSMVFSTFLLHVLKVVRPGDDGRETESQLDDKHLVKRFDGYLRTAHEQGGAEARVKQYAYALLKCRFLFDNYVLKREFTATSGDDGAWSLRRLAIARSGTYPRYVSSFGYVPPEGEGAPDAVGKEIALLQAALRVTYTSPRTMHWITRVLQHLWPMTSHEQVQSTAVLGLLRDYARRRVAASFQHGELITGFGINRIVFTYLDYLLAVKDGDLGFRFTYRNSIEHFYPQAVDPSREFPPLEDERMKELFGNLALVSVSDNSKFSNSPPQAKAGFPAIVKQSPKLKRMAEVAGREPWSDTAIQLHHDDMVRLLRADIGLPAGPT